MAGNIKADSNGDVYVEFDYNNIILFDPNKTIDKYNKVQERLVDHENLVMFVNLEADVLPRTKLAVGGATPQIQTISIAKINFLKPNNDNYFTSSYYDELTGKDSVNLRGQNQAKQQIGNITLNGTSYRKVKNTVVDQNNVVDNGLLGITNINISTKSSFIPEVRMELEDVQGKALFQLGDNSPYAAFFNLPYPQFYLTIKGYYGQAIRYQLNLERFNAKFNTFSGNYQVSLEFKGYRFNILNEISIGHLLAAPHMYSQTHNITYRQDTNSQDNLSTQITSERGYEKIKEVFSEYKSKGLVPADLPEITLVQLMNALENFENSIIDSYPPANLVPLTDIRVYKTNLKRYYDEIRGNISSSWFTKYLNPTPFVLEGGDFVYIFKKNIDYGQRQSAISNLDSLIKNFNNEVLKPNPTLGNRIKNNITKDMIKIPVSEGQINWRETYSRYAKVLDPSTVEVNEFRKNYINLIIPTEFIKNKNGIEPTDIDYFIFEGTKRFDKEIIRMEAEANKFLSQYETSISADLANRLQSSKIGIGFKPTVRNIIGIIMASAEGFIRLLDEVHTNAWNVKYDPVRKNAILNNPSSVLSSDAVNNLVVNPVTAFLNLGSQILINSQIPVYPWPQFFVESNDSNKNRFELTYIGDPSVVDSTKGFLYEKWPEVEFVEEYMRGLTQKFNPPLAPPPLENQRDTDQMNLNAIEYPQLGISYINKNEVKFYYEIWERQFLTSHYSGLIRINNNTIDQIIELNSKNEAENIKNSLGLSSPYLTNNLKNYAFNSSNYEDKVLKNFSNQGTGKSYQDFIRDFFVTGYIKGITESPFSILSVDDLGKNSLNSVNTSPLQNLVKGTFNEPLIVDTLPFTDSSWVQSNMAGSAKNQGNQVYNTNNSLFVASSVNMIANFDGDVYKYNINRPVSNFSYLQTITNPTPTNGTMDLFYINRSLIENSQKFLPTEGYCTFSSATQQFNIIKTTSMLNTPFFVNAILEGVNLQRNNNPYPYIKAAYLFLNSLPIATLKEKYKSYENNSIKDLDYIASVFKKYGAIHKMPYAWVLKMGSIWHRYKKQVEDGVDILDTVWKDFDYVKNYSPILNSTGQTYTFEYNKNNISITLQKESDQTVTMNVGFYPKVITDFNYFYNGYDFYSGYTDTEIQESINNGVKVYNFGDSNINSVNFDSKIFTQKTWSVVIPALNLDNNVSDDCIPIDNTVDANYFIVPSFGTNVNQTYVECVDSKQSTVDGRVNLINNPNIYNGSVRSLWGASNYGYFDSSQAIKSETDSYLNRYNSNDVQSAFSILNYNGYSKIEEIFSVFEKSILDKFEEQFLNFSKPGTNSLTEIPFSEYNVISEDRNYIYKNFQILFKNLMSVPAQTNNDDDEYFKNLIQQQLVSFNNYIKGFMEYDVILRNGNPSNYRRRTFDSYRSYESAIKYVTNPITFNPYVENSLPSSLKTTTVAQSKLLNPDAWNALELEIGFSTIDNIKYSDNGSYITDFFIDNNIEFTEQNVVLLSPLIKMYATEKLRQPATNAKSFKQNLTNYLNSIDELQDNFLNLTLTEVRKILPEQSELPEKTIRSAFDSQQSKIENYEIFKALNDKWVAGGDFSERTLFEDFLFLDRASRNVGDKLLVNIFDLKNTLKKNNLNVVMPVLTFISNILIQNNFTVMNLPAYVNFYNIQEVDGTTVPKTEGSLEFANNMWGTFLDVDYRKSSPKIVCFFVGKPSEYLEMPKGNFKFNDDGLDLFRLGKNPLIEDQTGKVDWALSNKCVGFNVDIGIRNQNVFNAFSVTQDAGLATSEAIQAQLYMIDQGSGRLTATQNVGLYNFYKLRSYKCEVVGLGNAMIQPTMYFNLRHVPMFNGPYFITNVEHSIQPGSFQTTFTGVRQSVFDLPSIDNFLQQVNQNLLTRLQELVKVRKDGTTEIQTTNNQKADNVVQNSQTSKNTENSCIPNVYYTDVTSQPYVIREATPSTITPEEFAKILKEKYPQNLRLALNIFLISYVRTYNNGSFSSFNNNFATVSLDVDLSPTDSFFEKTYSCVNVNNKSTPIANFKDIQSFIQFMDSRIRENVDRITKNGITRYYVCNWPKNNTISEDFYLQNVNRYSEVKTSFRKGTELAITLGLTTFNEAKEFVEASNNPTGVTQTATTISTDCSPPILTSFSPSIGKEGMIIQINGENLSSISGMTITPQVNTLLPTKVNEDNITIINSSTLRFNLPYIDTGAKIPLSVSIESEYGSSSGTTFFYYDPLMITMYQSANPSMSNSDSPPPQNTVNTQPQQTGVVTMESIYVELDSVNTSLLTVFINPQLTNWKIDTIVTVAASYFEVSKTNDQVLKRLVSEAETNIENEFLFDNYTRFEVTNLQVLQLLQTNFPNVPIIKGKTDINLNFRLTAYSILNDVTPVEQTFNFKLGFSTEQFPIADVPIDITNATYPEVPILILNLGETTSPIGQGSTYYNIIKPGGGYLNYQIQVPTTVRYDNQNLTVLQPNSPDSDGFPVIIKSNGEIAKFDSVLDSDTNYAYRITVEEKGAFRVAILAYKPFGNMVPNGGQVLTQRIVGPIFTI